MSTTQQSSALVCKSQLKNVPEWGIPKWFFKKLGLLRLRRWIRNRKKRQKSVSVPSIQPDLSLKEVINECLSFKSWDERLPYVKTLYHKMSGLFSRSGCFRSWKPLDVPEELVKLLKIKKFQSHDVKLCPSSGRFVARDYDAAISIGLKFFENL